MALPKIMFVREETDNEGSKFLISFSNPQEAVENDGPTMVGTYKLVGKRRLIKQIQEVKK